MFRNVFRPHVNRTPVNKNSVSFRFSDTTPMFLLREVREVDNYAGFFNHYGSSFGCFNMHIDLLGFFLWIINGRTLYCFSVLMFVPADVLVIRGWAFRIINILAVTFHNCLVYYYPYLHNLEHFLPCAYKKLGRSRVVLYSSRDCYFSIYRIRDQFLQRLYSKNLVGLVIIICLKCVIRSSSVLIHVTSAVWAYVWKSMLNQFFPRAYFFVKRDI